MAISTQSVRTLYRRRPFAAFTAASWAITEHAARSQGSTLLIGLPFPAYVPALVATTRDLGLCVEGITPEVGLTARAALYAALASRALDVLVTSEHLPRDFPYRRVDQLVLIEPDGRPHNLISTRAEVVR